MTTPKTHNCRFARESDLESILLIHKRCKKSLGPLPDAVFIDAVATSELIACEQGGSVVGYVLFSRRATHFDVRITHLAVDPDARRSRAATEMISCLAEEECERERIVCSVRSDFEGARSFWELNGFQVTSDRPGRATTAPSELKVYVRPLALPSNLFDAEFERSMRVPIHIDLNILIDLVTDRPAGAASRRLFANLQGSDLQPMRTSVLVNELANHNPLDERRRAQALVAQWPSAASDPGRGSPDLLQAFSDAEEADRKYLAAAHECAQTLLVTRDEPFLIAAKAAAEFLGVRVVDPTTYEASLRDVEGGNPAAGWSELSVASASSQNLADLLNQFVNHSSGERKAELRHRLEAAFADPQRGVYRVTQKSEAVALFSIGRDGTVVTVDCLRASARWRSPVLARRLISEIRSKALEGVEVRSPVSIQFDDEYIDRALGQAVRGQSVVSDQGVPTLVAVSGAVEAGKLLEIVRSTLGSRVDETILESMADEPWELELLFEPVFVTEPALPAYMVPIYGGWADRLVGASRVSPNLMGRDDSLARSPANVYFSGKNYRPRVPARLRVCPEFS